MAERKDADRILAEVAREQAEEARTDRDATTPEHVRELEGPPGGAPAKDEERPGDG